MENIKKILKNVGTSRNTHMHINGETHGEKYNAYNILSHDES